MAPGWIHYRGIDHPILIFCRCLILVYLNSVLPDQKKLSNDGFELQTTQRYGFKLIIACWEENENARDCIQPYQKMSEWNRKVRLHLRRISSDHSRSCNVLTEPSNVTSFERKQNGTRVLKVQTNTLLLTGSKVFNNTRCLEDLFSRKNSITAMHRIIVLSGKEMS